MKNSVSRFFGMCAVLSVILFSVACSHSANGVYFFDGDAFRSALKTTDDPALKDIPEDVLTQTLDGLKDFQIEVKDAEATATFGDVVVKGALTKTSDGKFTMTPVDEDKKSDVVTLIVKGNTLILDPGKKEIDRMFFKKKS